MIFIYLCPAMILITGAGGMLGGYLKEQFQNEKIATLGLRSESDYNFDLTKETPDFNNSIFNLVIHAAGTEEDRNSGELNLEGTKRLLKALEKNPPNEFVYISSYKVYSRDAGEDIDEETPTWATSEAGKSKALAEECVKEWCEERDVTLTIVRPARMFGNGVKGETLQLFNDALGSKYIHIRDNNAKVSLVCALDVARGIKEIYKYGGIYNVSDGRPVKFLDMMEAMTANAGAKKRMTHLPANWAEWVWRLGKWIPSIHRNLAPEVVESRMKTLTLNGAKFANKAAIDYYDTIAVIEHTDKNYPYTSSLNPNSSTRKCNIHEV